MCLVLDCTGTPACHRQCCLECNPHHSRWCSQSSLYGVVTLLLGGWPLSSTSVWSVGGATETGGETEEQGISHEHKQCVHNGVGIIMVVPNYFLIVLLW